jgi:hypothetical protein
MADLSTKTAALAVIHAVESGDSDKFEQAFLSVDDDVVNLLEKFLVEVATGRYEVFTKQDAPHIASNPNYTRAILRIWRRVGSARRKMAARMAFETMLTLSRRNR